MTTDGRGQPEDRRCAGLVLAAGAGQRYGGPKALEPGWVRDRVVALTEAGCAPVLVVLGAAAIEARALVPPAAEVVVAERWHDGMGASLRAGLAWCAQRGVVAVMVAVVDTPGLTAAAVRRVLTAGGAHLTGSLVQATYHEMPGHPVLLGRVHWPGVVAVAQGDRGARDYLAGHAPVLVECGDIADGTDVDVRPASLDD